MTSPWHHSFRPHPCLWGHRREDYSPGHEPRLTGLYWSYPVDRWTLIRVTISGKDHWTFPA